MTEQTFLVAITVDGTASREDAESWLHRQLPRPGADVDAEGVTVESWWIAEDDRHDGSDCDSAVVVHPGAQEAAGQLLSSADLAEPQFRSSSGDFDVPDWDEIDSSLLPIARFIIARHDRRSRGESPQVDRP